MTFSAEIVFVRILLPYCLGICLSYFFLGKEEILPCTLIVLLLFAVLVLINIFYPHFKVYNFKGQVGILVLTFWLVFGALCTLKNNMRLRNDYFGAQSFSQIKGWICNEPQFSSGILRFELMTTTAYQTQQQQAVTGKILVALITTNKDQIQLNYGDELMIPANYSPVDAPANPGEFNFKAWLAAKNTFHQIFINQNQLVKLNSGFGNSVINYAIRLRKKQVDTYRKLIHNDEAFAVASTLVLGYRADLSKETLTAYSKTGTIHALSVSGMHVGIIYIFLNWALFFFNRNRFLKIVKIVLICALIWYYSLLTGFSPSVLRSAVMLSVYILAKAFNKNSNSYNILAFTAFCLLFYDPFLIWDVGFQLSFLAVFGLIYLQPKIYNWFSIKNKWLDKLWATVALSLAAQFTTFPLSIYYFHQFPLYFIFSNLFILLPLTAMMYLGISILLLRLYFLAPLFEWIINFTNNGLKSIADLPFSGITSIWISPLQLVILSLTLIVLTVALVKYDKKLLLGSILLLVVFQVISACQYIDVINQRKILFFSLRRNYAAAFINRRHAVLITDLSTTDKSYDFYIKPALEQLQLREIEFINWKKDTTINQLCIKDHQLSFSNYHILLLDQQLNGKTIRGLPKFDAIWVHQNPKKELVALRTEVLFSTLLLDASNKDHLIKKYMGEANKINVNAYTLKKNKAYLIDLNK